MIKQSRPNWSACFLYTDNEIFLEILDSLDRYAILDLETPQKKQVNSKSHSALKVPSTEHRMARHPLRFYVPY